ncbi:ADP-ribosylation factor-like protein [Lentisphaera profundi]|uniref:ADP-ribosylation factor-like protein n=1 Tax=Lentisphaera profundi TaxID=1658616 RepID=A0ABY7VSK7_9BACT|nr:ADP-ribosylation factor-like protein [Lentisphaera profundi]WDE95877.1 ADP-ribosylation factor-like protein [Lentisphaera profundi]
MAVVNYAKKEIQFKIVYYGPGLCGKTTNLQIVHEKMPGESKGKMSSLATSQDRTLFFDFLPLKSDAIEGYTTKFQMYTVPGQVKYNSTRKLVLRNCDGVVFVADSQIKKMPENIESLQNLDENLKEQGSSVDEMPLVFQYNKRDMKDVSPVEYMDFLINNGPIRMPVVNGVACDGDGVFETLNAISKLVLHDFIQKKNQG